MGCLNGSAAGSWAADDDPGGRADEPRRDVGAVERERADEPQLGRVGHVDLSEDGVGRLVGGDAGGERGQRLDPVAAAREDEQPVAVQEQLVAQPRLERERVEQPRLRTGDVDRAQLPVRDGEDRVPVRLDEVRLVDTFLLHVRAGEIDALDGCRRRRGAGDGWRAPRSAAGGRSCRSRTGRRTASPAPSRSRAAGRRCRTRSASASPPEEPSGRRCPPGRRPRRPPARSAPGVERASSPWLYASEATIVTPEGVAFA